MINGAVNKKSGILVIMLPSTGCTSINVSHDGEKEKLYPHLTSWVSNLTRADYETRYPSMPARLIDNLLQPNAKISVANWSLIEADFSSLDFLIEATFSDRIGCKYDLTREMRRANS